MENANLNAIQLSKQEVSLMMMMSNKMSSIFIPLPRKDKLKPHALNCGSMPRFNPTAPPSATPHLQLVELVSLYMVCFS